MQIQYSKSVLQINKITNFFQPFYLTDGDLVYADLDDQYGPINYKAASIYAAMKRNKNNRLEEVDGKTKPPNYYDVL